MNGTRTKICIAISALMIVSIFAAGCVSPNQQYTTKQINDIKTIYFNLTPPNLVEKTHPVVVEKSEVNGIMNDFYDAQKNYLTQYKKYQVRCGNDISTLASTSMIFDSVYNDTNTVILKMPDPQDSSKTVYYLFLTKSGDAFPQPYDGLQDPVVINPNDHWHVMSTELCYPVTYP